MATTSTFIWRAGVLALLAATVPAGIALYAKSGPANTGAMLDVSVSIRTVSHVRTDAVGDSVWEAGGGSGFLISSRDCEVWTNHHVIEDAAMIEVHPRGWDRSAGIPATVVSATPLADFAILRMAHCEGIPQARLGDSSRLTAGAESYAVGNPLGRNPDSITRGIISHTQRYISGAVAYLQTDAAINPGNSGGALFNRDGEVIGINTAIANTRGGANVGVGYAVPVNTAREVAARLRSGAPDWGRTGIETVLATLTSDEAEVFGVPGGRGAVIVSSTPKDAAGAGKVSARDVIYRIDDVNVTDAHAARRLIAARRVGESVTLHLMRAGEAQAVTLELTAPNDTGERHGAQWFDGLLGMDLEMWRDAEDERGRFETPVITRVYDLGPAHRALIASSQKNITVRGPFAFSYMLDVKTVTGVVLDGKYTPVATLGDLDQVVRAAHSAAAPVLLEIALWVRTDPMNASSELEHVNTAFFRVQPEPSLAQAPPVPEHPDADPQPVPSGLAGMDIEAQFWRPRELPARGPSA